MKISFLDFESPIAELEDKIEQLRYIQDDSALDIADEISRLSKKSEALTKDVYAKLSPWQISQVSRHPQRPYTLDYIEHLFTDFEELHGDRSFGDDKAIVAGLARFNGQSVMVIGHQKGRDTKEKIVRNFRQPHQAHRLAITFGTRHAEIAHDLFLGIATFLMADHHHALPVETRQSGHDGLVIPKGAVAVQFFKIGEQMFDVIQRVRTLRMTRHL